MQGTINVASQGFDKPAATAQSLQQAQALHATQCMHARWLYQSITCAVVSLGRQTTMHARVPEHIRAQQDVMCTMRHHSCAQTGATQC